jgi:hypothetical protein
MELCRKRPVIYSDLDHLKKGSTGFLHELGYSKEDIALALDPEVREVKNNLKGTGFELDMGKILKFKDRLPSNIGDVIAIHIPPLLKDGMHVDLKGSVIQCILKGEKCGLLVELLEDVVSEVPTLAGKMKGEEITVPLEWYVSWTSFCQVPENLFLKSNLHIYRCIISFQGTVSGLSGQTPARIRYTCQADSDRSFPGHGNQSRLSL